MATMHHSTMVVLDAAPRPHQRIWPLIAGVALALHGAIHLMGFVVDWRLAQLQMLPYRTTALAGHLELGTAGTQILGVLWLLAVLGFLAVGAGLVWHGRPWGLPITGVALLSLILCILSWPDSAFGALIDVAIVAALARAAIMRSRHVA